MDDVRRRTIDSAQTEATALARRLARFVEEYGGKGAQVLTMGETAWIASAQRTLAEFGKRGDIT